MAPGRLAKDTVFTGRGTPFSHQWFSNLKCVCWQVGLFVLNALPSCFQSPFWVWLLWFAPVSWLALWRSMNWILSLRSTPFAAFKVGSQSYWKWYLYFLKNHTCQWVFVECLTCSRHWIHKEQNQKRFLPLRFIVCIERCKSNMHTAKYGRTAFQVSQVLLSNISPCQGGHWCLSNNRSLGLRSQE